MIKKYEVEQLIKDALLDMNGAIDGKPNSEGYYDVYFVSTKKYREWISG